MTNYANPTRTRRDVAGLLKPPNREPISQSARRLLYVEQSGAMVPWDGDLVPYMHEPMDCLKSRLYDAVVFAGPARTAKTVSLIDAWVCDTVVNDPADFLLVQISQDKAAEFSKKRLSRSFAASPDIRAAMSPRAHDNNVHDKVFKSGNFLKIGWPSKNIFASSDWKRVAITDLDRMPLNIDGEGSAFFLAGKRTQTFMSSGMVLAESSPGFPIEDVTWRPKTPHEAPPTRGILSLYNQGDRRLYHWQCPDCLGWYEPDFDLLQYDDAEPDPARASKEVVIACPHCGTCYQETDRQSDGLAFKLSRNRGGLWIPEGCEADEDSRLHGEARETRIASFWQKGPTAAFQTWSQLVYKYVAAMGEYESTGSEEDLKTTVNTDQGKAYMPPRASDSTAQAYLDRREELGVNVVPEWVRFLTASVDVQAGSKTARFDVKVLGWGRDLECVIIDRFSIEKSKRESEGDSDFVRVNPAAYLEDWDLLTEKVIKRSYPLDNNTGKFMPILRTACDSGGEDGVTDNAYSYYRSLREAGLHRRFMLIKGRGTGPPIYKSYPDNSKRTDRKAKARGDVPVFLLNTDKIKDTVFHALGRETPGRRYVHIPKWIPERFIEELVAEERSADGKWKKRSRGIRNESFDLFVYCWACLYELGADTLDWDNPPPWAVPAAQSGELLSQAGEAIKPPPRRRRRSSM